MAAAAEAVSGSAISSTSATAAVPFGLDRQFQLGEGSLWDESLFGGRGGLLHVDIIGQRLMVLDCEADSPINYSWKMPSRIGTVVPCTTEDMVVVALADGLYSMKLAIPTSTPVKEPGATGALVPTIDLPDPALTRVAEDPESEMKDNRLNDGKCDPFGRLWVGSMRSEAPRERTGALYCFDPAAGGATAREGSAPDRLPRMSKILEKIGVSNGVAWSADGRRMYYIDSFERRVSVLDYDPATGAASGRRTAFEFAEEDGTPDGCVMDEADRLWVAHFNGGQVTCTDTASGERIRSLSIPGATQVTSVALGGVDRGDLFVTTAREDMGSAEVAKFPESGTLFIARGVGAKGKPAARLGL